MAGVPVNPSASYTVAADVVGADGYQRVKLNIGISGTTSLDVGATTPLPVTGSVAVVPGVSVVAQVSGTITVAPTVFTVNTLAAGASVNALVTGVVSVSAMPAVSISVSAALGTVITILGTQVVSVVPGVSVNALVTGVVSISVLPAVSISVSAVLGTIVTQLGTQMVSIAQTSVSIAALPTVNTIITILGLQVVTVTGTQLVTNASIFNGTAGAPAANATGLAVWNIGMAITTAAPSAAGTGQIVWNAGTAMVSVVSVALQPVLIMLPNTVVGSNTTMLFSVHTGATFVTTAASFWVVPAGKVFRIMAIQMANKSSAVLAMGNLCVIVGTAAASLSVTSTVGKAACLMYGIEGTTRVWDQVGMVADIAAGTSIAIAVTGGTTQTILGGIIQGYLF